MKALKRLTTNPSETEKSSKILSSNIPDISIY